MGNKRAQHALNAVVFVASLPAACTATTQMLADELNLSVSYLEGLLKVLKQHEILRAYRGPGGGYQLAKPAADFSAWDVVAAFDQDSQDAVEQAPRECDAWVSSLNQAYAQEVQRYLEACPLSSLVGSERQPKVVSKNLPAGNQFNLRPMPKPLLPRAPKSVFDLSAFLLAETA